ncbi:Uncharacterised protein [Candidatus Gugararchaeum adminiculabundum]|nr:Uncharacterised protein [Candidatus Gugararchaeum adminiculabundum]
MSNRYERIKNRVVTVDDPRPAQRRVSIALMAAVVFFGGRYAWMNPKIHGETLAVKNAFFHELKDDWKELRNDLNWKQLEKDLNWKQFKNDLGITNEKQTGGAAASASTSEERINDARTLDQKAAVLGDDPLLKYIREMKGAKAAIDQLASQIKGMMNESRPVLEIIPKIRAIEAKAAALENANEGMEREARAALARKGLDEGLSSAFCLDMYDYLEIPRNTVSQIAGNWGDYLGQKLGQGNLFAVLKFIMNGNADGKKAVAAYRNGMGMLYGNISRLGKMRFGINNYDARTRLGEKIMKEFDRVYESQEKLKEKVGHANADNNLKERVNDLIDEKTRKAQDAFSRVLSR